MIKGAAHQRRILGQPRLGATHCKIDLFLSYFLLKVLFIAKTLILLLGATLAIKGSPSYAKTSTSNFNQSDQECMLYFTQECLAKHLISQSKTLSVPLAPELVIEATSLAMEMQLPKKYQDKIWPYHYKDTTKLPIAKIFSAPALLPIWQEVSDFTNLLKQTKPQALTADTCFEILNNQNNKNQVSPTTPLLALVQVTICASPQLEVSLSQLLAQHQTKTLPVAVRLQVLHSIYKYQLQQAQLEAALETSEKIVVESAAQSLEIQIQARIKIIETQISYGFSELGSQEIAQFTTHVSTIIQVLAELDLHKKWSAFIETSRQLASEPNLFTEKVSQSSQSTQESQNIEKNTIKNLITSQAHQDFLNAIATRSPALQLSFFRQTIQSFFQSFFNASPSHDLVLAFYSQQWITQWQKLQDEAPFLEGLKMLLLEARISSYAAHQKLILQNRY